jgi:formylglycine-generating enzyme required for sulfatase activity
MNKRSNFLMNTDIRRVAIWVALGTLLAVTGIVGGAQITWNGSADDLWSNSANWTGGTPAGSDLVFNNTGASSTAGAVTSIMDQTYMVNSLSFTNTQYQKLLLQNGVNVIVNGDLTVGNSSISSNVIISGSESTINATSATVASGNLIVDSGASLGVTNSFTLGYTSGNGSASLDLAPGARLHLGSVVSAATVTVASHNGPYNWTSATFAPNSVANPNMSLYVSTLTLGSGNSTGTMDLSKYFGPLAIGTLNIGDGGVGSGQFVFGNAINHTISFPSLSINHGSMSINSGATLNILNSFTLGYTSADGGASLNLSPGAKFYLGSLGSPASMTVASHNGPYHWTSASFAPDSDSNPDMALYMSTLTLGSGNSFGSMDLTKYTGPLVIGTLNIGDGGVGSGQFVFGNSTNNNLTFPHLSINKGELKINADSTLRISNSFVLGYTSTDGSATLNLAPGARFILGTPNSPASFTVASHIGTWYWTTAIFAPNSVFNPEISLDVSTLTIGSGNSNGTLDLTNYTGPLSIGAMNIGDGGAGSGHFIFGNPVNNLLTFPSLTITNGDITINPRSTLKVTNTFSVSSRGQLKLNIGGTPGGLWIDSASTSALSLASGTGRITIDFGNPDAPTPEYYGLKWKGDHLADLRARLNQYGHTGDGTIRIETSGAYAARCPLSLTLGIENGFIYTYLGLNAAIPAEMTIAHADGGGSITNGGTVDFGTRVIGIPISRSFTMTNTGPVPLSGISAVVEGPNAADFVLSVPPAAALVAGGSSPYTITLNGLATGPRSATLRITSSDTARNPVLIQLTTLGTAPEIGIEQPQGTTLAAGASQIDFGSVNLGSVSNPFVFTIRNTGSATLSGIAISKSGDHTADFTVGNLGLTEIAPGGTSTFTVTFNPGGAGARIASLLIGSNDADESPFEIELSGFGVPSVAKDILTFDFEWLDGARIDGTFITLEVPYGTDVTALSPVYTISPRATCTPASGATRSFATLQTYTVTAEDGTSKNYTVTVMILPPKLMIPSVLVGNPGNAPDPATGYGAVSQPFRMGRNETNVSQYAVFLNAVAKDDTYGLYHPSMSTDSATAGIVRIGAPGAYVYAAIPGTENRPIAWVSWFDAARFANWLHNRQPTGNQDAATTEDGAYTLNGITSGVGVARNPAARFWIPSEDEWYKAAYYDPAKDATGGYWRYPAQSDTLAGNTIGVAKSANYFDGDYVGSGTASYPTGNALTDGGAYGTGSLSRYGTADQAGNLWEWNDAVIAAERGTRGGCFDADGPEENLSALHRGSAVPSLEDNRHGFRCAMSPLSDFAQSFPAAPATATGGVTVWIEPAAVGGWRFVGELAWRQSGTTASALVAGDWQIEFRPVSGYLQPLTEVVTVANGAITPHTASYYPAGASGNGSLSVVLKPDSVASAIHPVVDRAQWRLYGEGNADWKDSGETVENLTAGAYVVEFKQIPGRVSPPHVSIHLGEYSSITRTFTYGEEVPLAGIAPEVLSFGTASGSVGMPYAFVGQLRGSAGSGSGFVVRRRVVATAGHVVFDDNLLAGAVGIQWLFQRDATAHEPKPQEPRGFYLFGGYAARRRVENTPGVSSPQSQELDVAALYFTEDAGRGGFSGYLASDETDNEFILSPALKTLIGYPVTGIAPAALGLMHATPPGAVSFAHGGSAHTYVSSAIRSASGMSGGPLCVRLDGGIYYPAGVYLGGSGQVVVRSFDSQVVTLFGRAEISGNGGANNTGGGISQTSYVPAGISSDPGSVRITIKPLTAVVSGARWGLVANGVTRSSGGQIGSLRPGTYTLHLSTVSGFDAPVPQPVTVLGGQISDITYTYLPNVDAPTITSATWDEGVKGSPFSYQMESNPPALSYSLFGSLPSGLVFDPVTGIISGTPLESGAFPVFLGATNAGGTGNMLCAIVVRPVIANQQTIVVAGAQFSYQVSSSESGAGVTYSAFGLPPGLAIHSATGLITGIPQSSGVHHGLVTVSRKGASASAILTVSVVSQQLAEWRTLHFGSIDGVGISADTADTDGDGRDNQSEFAAGSNPLDGADFFKVLTSTRTGLAFSVTALGKARRVYELQRRNDLVGEAWNTITTTGPLVADGSVFLTDGNAPLAGAFYRIQVTLP